MALSSPNVGGQVFTFAVELRERPLILAAPTG